MRLHPRSGGAGAAPPVVCVHGIGQHGGVFEELGRRLAESGRRTVAVGLRGHGGPRPAPPWSPRPPVADLVETMDAEGIGAAPVVGHSFGAAVAAALAARESERVSALTLHVPGVGTPKVHALKSAEMARLDGSFASVDGAVNALLASDSIVAPPRETVAACAASDLRRGADGR